MVCTIDLFSKILDMSCDITVIGPKIIDINRPLRVTYLLHGLTGNTGNWQQYTGLVSYAKDGNTLFVLPSVGRSWYTDMQHGQKYFTYITQELPQLCKSLFNISDKREHTAIMGNSMGGYGALKCALTFPEQYGICCAFSPAALYWREYLAMPNCAGLLSEFQGIFGVDLQVSLANEIMYLAQRAQSNEKKPIIRSFCGTNDFLYEMNCRFSRDMKRLQFDYMCQEWQGEHDWLFWDTALRRALDEFGC